MCWRADKGRKGCGDVLPSGKVCTYLHDDDPKPLTAKRTTPNKAAVARVEEEVEEHHPAMSKPVAPETILLASMSSLPGVVPLWCSADPSWPADSGMSSAVPSSVSTTKVAAWDADAAEDDILLKMCFPTLARSISSMVRDNLMSTTTNAWGRMPEGASWLGPGRKRRSQQQGKRR